KPPPPSYTVKIVDSLPAGDLGTHLPRLSQNRVEHHEVAPPEVIHREAPTSITPPPPPLPDNDKEAIALNTVHSPNPTPQVKPTPTPTPVRTPPPPSPKPSPSPTRRLPKPLPARPTATPTPHAQRPKPKAAVTRESVEATPKATPNIGQEMIKLHQKLLAE